MKKYLCALFAVLSAGCATVPKGMAPVSGFEVQRYLGTWHEIARLDHSFERGLVSVTAEYSLRQDGGVKVVNRGYKTSSDKWKEAEGRAYFTGDRAVGQLKVSFFRPFYGGYNIIELDRENYSYAMVAGPSRSYLWILARAPELPPQIIRHLVIRARELGFDTEKLIFPGILPQIK
ncbi:MAG: lipocalin [Elusimicrobia bacterium GWC2_51_8]|nr:MAG: lipocalin [Elusimicrobia bacterium GWA2_51_34]OGR57550.1 MAG: lipocalin [Elusimicrobia bacterium GWC2_51_8]OGR84920.1 MAG: lipocalin [Elusimicrobia bacterium GWF2_52_66]HAF95603.1 lipocalin [Elusimicrobiota bacterium]HCE98826.1 lipocalin [Elusimicrobiota bacterium]